jgi:type I restriction-modification system DNA methylase subunit
VYGDPPQGNANYAWLQHMLHHLKPTGRAGIVLANGSMSSSQNSEGEIRAAMVDADVVEVMVALPGQLFFNTQIPACLWFLVKQKTHRKGEVPPLSLIERKGHTASATFHLAKGVAKELKGKAAYTKTRGLSPVHYAEMVREYLKDHQKIRNAELRELLGLGDSPSAQVEASR